MPIVQATKENISKATMFLKQGGVIAFPTETVYGLGCNTLNTEAVSLAYTTKKRPTNNPLIAHVSNSSQAKKITTGWDSQCDDLAKQFWPGPLTLILNKHKRVPKEACGGGETIAVRSPDHPVAQQLLQTFDGSISAPSANISGYVSPTTAQHVLDDFGDTLFILDGGTSSGGIESTVLSLLGEPKIVRLGSIPIEQIRGIVPNVTYTRACKQTDSPGTSSKHYATKTPLLLVQEKDLHTTSSKKSAHIMIHNPKIDSLCSIILPCNPVEYAKKLYASMRKLDSLNPEKIYVELPPTSSEWDAIHDRLQRAAFT
ncbi:MAG: L-threonylcarbamoyladenylate synthase [Phycisphaerales bacterium]|jgi:L-threonylcarbamoyladenylate synthase|nr:L-threonylcarbamoyladenylate synthase [Phycisphaerales bacterium]